MCIRVYYFSITGNPSNSLAHHKDTSLFISQLTYTKKINIKQIEIHAHQINEINIENYAYRTFTEI